MCSCLVVAVCIVDGGWSEWQEQSECTATCGGGMITKKRTCTVPSPSCGGSDCEGDSITDFPCNTHCCPGKYINAQNVHVTGFVKRVSYVYTPNFAASMSHGFTFVKLLNYKLVSW